MRYVDGVRAAGGTPLVLPPGEAKPERLLDLIDGLILAGGGDIAPAAYGGEPHGKPSTWSPRNVISSFTLARAALARPELPVMCICRGMQVLNRVCMERSVPARFGDRVPHRLPPRLTSRHTVRIEPGSRVAQVLGVTQAEVCSWHHERSTGSAAAARCLGGGRCGRSDRAHGHPWCLGVQWHPEKSSSTRRRRSRCLRRWWLPRSVEQSDAHDVLEGTMARRLESKVALITGLAVASVAPRLNCLPPKAHVLVAVDADERRRAVVDEITAQGGTAAFVRADVSDAADMKAMISACGAPIRRAPRALRQCGNLPDADGSVVDTDEAVFDRVIAVNLKGIFLGCKYGVPALLRAGGGSINTASFVAVLGSATSRRVRTRRPKAALTRRSPSSLPAVAFAPTPCARGR